MVDRRRTSRIGRYALFAWVWFVVAASATPFFWIVRVYEPDKTVLWMFGGGGMRRVAFPTPVTQTHPALEWDPGVTLCTEFYYARSYPGGGSVRRPPHILSAPPWATLLVPTLLIGAPLTIRAQRHKRRALPPGRTPCPVCGYDATGLSTCPECGVAITTTPPKTEPQA